jgi:hypothetical protein
MRLAGREAYIGKHGRMDIYAMRLRLLACAAKMGQCPFLAAQLPACVHKPILALPPEASAWLSCFFLLHFFSGSGEE